MLVKRVLQFFITACATATVFSQTSSASFAMEQTEMTSCSANAAFSVDAMSSCTHLCMLDSACLAFLFVPGDSHQCQVCTTTDTPPTTSGGNIYGRKVFTDCSDPAPSFTGYLMVRPLQSTTQFMVYCDSGWTIFQRRFDGSVDFDRDWATYKHGFGSLDGEFWLGNEKIHLLTAQSQYKMSHSMTRLNDDILIRNYDSFALADEADKYRLSISTQTENVNGGSSMSAHNGLQFTTTDNDNDGKNSENCASSRRGGWWFDECGTVLLNNYYPYNGGCSVSPNYLCFKYQSGVLTHKNLKASEMKIQKV